MEKELPLGPVNEERLQRIKRIILEEPRRFFMEGFFIDAEGVERIDDYTPEDGPWENLDGHIEGCSASQLPVWYEPPICKTTACIAGWANVLASLDRGAEHLEQEVSDMSRARRWLEIGEGRGLSCSEKFALGLRLFLIPQFYDKTGGKGWPEPYASRYLKAHSAQEAAQAAADYLDFVCGFTEEEGETFMDKLPPEKFRFTPNGIQRA